MKPDFEKMADGLMCIPLGIIRKQIIEDLRKAYAAGYRDGQLRMRERCYEISRGSAFDTVIEEAAIEESQT